MNKVTSKMVVVPIDGSENALRALDYISLIFGSKYKLKVILFYLLPSLPQILIEESTTSDEMARKFTELEKKNREMAQLILSEGEKRLLDKGFKEQVVETVFQKREVGIARDICYWSENMRADAIIISTRGLSRLKAFFMGETANKVLEFNRSCPVYMVKGAVRRKNILLAVDNSQNAMRAVDYAGFMLPGTEAHVTIFHSKRDLKRFMPNRLLEEFPEFQKLWKHTAGEVVAPYLKKAKDILIKAGLKENQVSIKLVEGSESAGMDILEEVENSDAGTIFIGKRGCSDVKDYSMGSVAKKVLYQASNMTVCIVP
ncbi:MAG: universal stress protein [Desulfobacterales bacterium]|nr:universal stress protein [Desulfobacterales bacterium]